MHLHPLKDFDIQNSIQYYVLIRDELFQQAWRPFSTFAHEYTHLIDYNNFIRSIPTRFQNNIKNHKYYTQLYLWSEFHANYNQWLLTMLFLYDLYNQLLTPDIFYKKVIQNLMVYENERICEGINAQHLSMPSLFSYLGKYAFCEKVYSEKYGNFKKMPQILLNELGNVVCPMYDYLFRNVLFAADVINFIDLSFATKSLSKEGVLL